MPSLARKRQVKLLAVIRDQEGEGVNVPHKLFQVLTLHVDLRPLAVMQANTVSMDSSVPRPVVSMSR